MSFITTVQGKVDSVINRLGTSVKIVSNSGDNIGRSKQTVAILTETTSDDLADSFITKTDKVVFLKGTIGFIAKEGDMIEFIKSKRVYTVIRTELYNIDDVAANSMAQKIFVRP